MATPCPSRGVSVEGSAVLAEFLRNTEMGVINSKLQEFHTADSKSATTLGKKDEKSKFKVKVSCSTSSSCLVSLPCPHRHKYLETSTCPKSSCLHLPLLSPNQSLPVISFQVTKKPVALKRFDQAFVKKPLPTRAQTPLVKVKKLKKPQRLGLYHRLNQKLNQNVQDELDQSEDSSTSSTTSDDLDSQ